MTKKTTGKTKQKKKIAAPPRRKPEAEENPFLRDTLFALLLFGIAACMIACFCYTEAPLCLLVSQMVFGLFGVVGFFVPALPLLAGVMRVLQCEKRGRKVVLLFLFLVFLASFINVCVYQLPQTGTGGDWFPVSDLWESGKAGRLFDVRSGGLVSILAVWLMKFAGNVIAGILLFVVMLGVLAYVTGITFVDFVGTREERQQARAERELAALEAEHEAALASQKEEEERRKNAASAQKPETEKKKRTGILQAFAEDEDESLEDRLDKIGRKYRNKGNEPKKDEPENEPEKDPEVPKGPIQDPEEITKEDVLHAKQEVATQISQQEQQEVAGTPYVFPPLDLLTKPPRLSDGDEESELRARGELLVNTLREYSVETTIANATKGPNATRYELIPATGVRINRITNLSDEIAMKLAAKSVRIEAPIPGKSTVGIEVSNDKTRTVYLREVIDTPAFRNAESKITAAIGKDIAGENVIADINKLVHLLIGGATGTGKSVCINSILISLLYKATPEDVRLILVDPKMVEFNVYRGIPHLLVQVVTNPKKAAGVLAWACMEMDARYEKLAMKNVRDIHGYNRNLSEGEKKMPHIVIVIDELADLMISAPKVVEESVARLSQKARAAGMHLIIATQRPSAEVVTGQIKANIPSRIALAVTSGINSNIILDERGAEKLLGKGDMLFDPIGATKTQRVQGCFVSDKEVENIVAFVKKNSCGGDFDDDIEKKIDKVLLAQQSKGKGGASSEDDEDAGDGADDEMLERAIQTVVEGNKASTTMLQSRLGLGYARAARLIDVMERRHIVGPYQGSKPREVLVTVEVWEEMKAKGLKEPPSEDLAAAADIAAEVDSESE